MFLIIDFGTLNNGVFIWISPYELRHTAFSIAQTLPEDLVKKMGGHSQNMDTFGMYGHKIDGDMQLTFRLMEERFLSLIK